MTTRPPVTVGEPEWDRGLWWMVMASGAIHLAAIVLILLIPHSFLHHPPPLMSYTVDLLAPDQVGGTNMIQGGKGRVNAPPMVAAQAPKVEPPPPQPKPEAPKPPEPPKAEPPKPEPVEVAKPQPPPEPPKPEVKPKDDEVALAVKEKKIEPPPAPTVAQAAPTPQPKVAPSPKIDPQVAKAAADAKAAEAKAAKDAAEAKARDERIAAATKAVKAAKEAKEAAEAKARDDSIAAAVKRVEQAGTRGGGSGSKAGEPPGGAISVGPGQGPGGAVMGVEYLMYYNMLQGRIKENWVWAGTNQGIQAVVHFNIAENGEVMNVRIVRSSGDASYDASVERAVRSLNPLSPPPEKYRQVFNSVEISFSPEQLQQ